MNINEAKNILHQYLINKRSFGNYQLKGSGTNGYAFILNEQVIKITKDMSELKTALFFINNPHPAIIEYFDVCEIEEYGVICMEELIPLDHIKHKNIILSWHELINPNSELSFNYELSTIRMDILDLRSQYELDLRELHWGNCGFDLRGNIKIMDLRLV